MDAGNFPEQSARRTIKTRCCIVGGGPAGMMLGYLLGRAGIETIVLEKHADFFRDFRGDTVHPSTLQVMDELGLSDGFLKLPHQRLQKMDGMFGGTSVRIADLSQRPLPAALDPTPYARFGDLGFGLLLILAIGLAGLAARHARQRA